jgi:hypothetical protein
MTLVPLAPPPGLDSDNSAFAAQGRWADGSNVRPYNGSMETIGRYSAVITLAGSQSIADLTQVGPSAGGTYTIIGTGNKLWAGVGFNSPTDVSPAGLVGNAGSWSFASYGDTLMCSPNDSKLYQYTLGGGAASHIAQAPVQIRVVLVARRQVLALGCNEEISGVFNGRCIRGSDIEGPTDWTTTSANNAFEYVLDDPGSILAGKVLGENIAVWTSSSLWLGTFVGNPSEVYQFERIEGAPGAVGPNAVCIFGQTVYWFAPDLQIWEWSPGAPPAAVPCPISKEFRDNLDSNDFIRIVAVPHFSEIWLFYVDSRDGVGDPSRYIAFNQQGQWFRGILARPGAWAGNGLFLATNTNVVYSHDLTTGTAPTWFLQSADQYMDNGRRRMMIRSCIPDFKDQAGDISLTIYTRDRPQSAETAKGPYAIANTATKKDLHASGKLLSVKLSGSSYMRLGKPTFDIVSVGER